MKDYTIYVTEEIAKKAIEKGFILTRIPDYVGAYIDNSFKFEDGHRYKICTAEQICGWLREEKGIDVQVHMSSSLQYYGVLVDTSRGFGDNETDCYQMYSEALLEGINKALELI